MLLRLEGEATEKDKGPPFLAFFAATQYEAVGHTPFRIVGKGKTNHSLYEMDTCFLALDKALADLIQSTIALLNNAKDGYVDADEKSAGLLQKLQGEVFGK